MKVIIQWLELIEALLYTTNLVKILLISLDRIILSMLTRKHQ